MSARVSLFLCHSDYPVRAAPHTYLDDDELERFQRMRPEVGHRFLLGRALAKAELARLADVDTTAIRFQYSANGKPTLVDHQHLHFNISHSSSAVAVAVGYQPVGVDVEEIERRRGSLEPPCMAPEKFMHSHTARWVAQAADGERARRFALLWTLMESQVKLDDSSVLKARSHLAVDIREVAEQPVQLGLNPMSQDHFSDCLWRVYGYEGVSGAANLVALANRDPAAEICGYLWREDGGHQAIHLDPLALSQALSGPTPGR